MNILIAGFQHETNTFAPTRADWGAFTAGHTFPAYHRAQAMVDAFAERNIPIAGFMARAAELGWTVTPSMWAGATPSSYITEAAFERIASEICGDVRAHMGRIDAIYLDLHGAAVAEHVDDTEGQLLQRLRAIVGPSMPIVASLDLHANVSEQMLSLADGMVSYRTYPHVDMADTGRLCADLLARRLQRGAREALAFFRMPYLIPINAQSTWMQPAQGIYEKLIELDGQTGSVMNFCMGFPAADIADCCAMLWGYGDNAHLALDELVQRVLPSAQWDPRCLPADEAVRRALDRAAASGAVLIADTQDNPGAGADSNTTGLLRELLAQGAGQRYPGRVALGLMCDEAAAALVHAAHARGQTSVELSLGQAVPTFTGALSDPPLTARFEIEKVSDGACLCTGPMLRGFQKQLGPSAALRIEGIRIALISGRAQLLDQALLRMVGIEPTQMKLIAIKSSNHFRADFTSLVQDAARDIFVAKASGPMAADPADLPWTKLQVSAKLI